jgi:hypothetical protein
MSACLVAAVMMAPASALAAPPKAESADKAAARKAAADEKEFIQSVEVSGLAFPVFDEEGRILNYIFVSGRLLVAEGKDPWKYREKGHFIRDAVLAAAHRSSFAMKDDYTRFDAERAAAECLKAANAAIGENALVRMTFTQIASQKPKMRAAAG